VFALGLPPDSGPGLIFATLPGVFARIPSGWVFGTLFFFGLAAAAYLSNVANLEVLVAGLVDTGKLGRRAAATVMVVTIYAASLIPMTHMEIFRVWDLVFGSGMQTLGALVAVVAFAWALDRSKALMQLEPKTGRGMTIFLYYWLRFVVPGAIIAMGVYFVATDVLGLVGPG
jgi:NSS family neurotransmitter:Na+ symporter